MVPEKNSFQFTAIPISPKNNVLCDGKQLQNEFLIPFACKAFCKNFNLLLYCTHRCIRFTMHQQRVSHSHDQDYNTMSQDRLKSCFRREITSSNLPQVPAHVGLSQVLANNTLARPQSSFVKNRPVTQHQTSRPQVRAKSAHPRLLQANKYMHTNASTTQLQVGDKEQGIFTLSFWTGEFSRKILSNSSTNGGVGNVFMES